MHYVGADVLYVGGGGLGRLTGFRKGSGIALVLALGTLNLVQPYLVDRDAAIRYAHSTIFKNMPLLTRYFPIRAHVAAYGVFVADHPHFMVLARSSHHDEWLRDKLRADSASVQFTPSLKVPAQNFQLYEIQR